jgi:hypothetical protein
MSPIFLNKILFPDFPKITVPFLESYGVEYGKKLFKPFDGKNNDEVRSMCKLTLMVE